YLLDENKQPVLKGMTGELYIGGSGLARGYLNLPDLTNERFISNPFSDEPTSKLYKTGDLARVLADGNIEILGRVDNQVKVRGFRVQMEAIEAILNQHTLVEQSVVMCHTDKSGAQRLIAYILTTNNTEIELWPLPGDYRVYDGIMYYAMTYDYVRNKSYEVAIRELVKDKVVVDIGTGKDIVWAKFCAESGAKKVYAVEMQHEAYEYAKNYVEALGLSNTISVIYGDAIKVELPEKVDICVSELIGSIGNSEGAVSILNNARKLLKEDGIMIPQRCVTNIATVYLPEQQANHPKFTELSGYYAQQIFNKLGRKIPIRVSFKNFPQSNIISTIDVFEDIDFNQASNPEYDREIRLTITQSGKIDGFLLWLNLYTVENEIIDHLSYIGNCLPVYFPVFYPGIEVTQGDIIEAICSARLSEDRLNPDYHIQGYLVKQTGERIKFEYDSFLYKTPTNSNLFYERLLAQEPVLNKQTNPAELSHESLLAYLKEYLPAYMLPTEFIALNSFPLGVNGKINRKALPIPKGNKKIQKASFVAPRNSWEFRLTKIWENLLGIQPISVIDNFFDLGGNSLLALRLMLEIELSFGQKLSLSTLFPNSTIENIAKILSKTNLKPSNYSLIPIQPSGIKPPFFCVHPIGGNVFCYKDLGQHLGHDQPFYGLQCAGIDGEIKPKTSIEDMAAYYIEAIRTIQPQGPYLIGGWSFGGIVAFEMAQQLYLSNQEVALLALIDCWAPHQYIRKPAKVDNAVILAWLADDLGDSLGRKIRISVKQLQSLKGDKQLNYVLDKLKAANILPSSMGIGEIQRLLEIALLNRQAERNYSPQVYQHPITLFRGNDNIEPQDSDPTMGWKDLTNLLEIKQIPGNHYTIIKKPNIQVLVKQLKISLCQAIKCM
ncbi:MAG: thioesterase domain-containing protein, partial [Cyanobacteria bacterium J06632_19]